MKLKLINTVDETSNVKSFFWEPSEEVNFIAGQYLYYTLPKLNYDDPRGATRHFTLSNSPTEGSLLRLTTKFPNPMSGYKKTLLELKVGDEIEGRGPQGAFGINNLQFKMNNVLIAGGIGITPFRSMIKYSFDKNLDLPYLIYSNSDENFVFGEELIEMLGDKLVFYNSKISGHLDKKSIENCLAKLDPALQEKLLIVNCTFYVVGPPKFVDAIESNLEQLGVGDDKIETEKFTGY